MPLSRTSALVGNFSSSYGAVLQFASSDWKPMARRPLQDAYRLNALQIPALRAFGCAVIAMWVLSYQLFVAQNFSLPDYASIVGVLAAYCVTSWLVIYYGYNWLRSIDLSLLFLVLDIPFLLYAIHHTGAEHSLLFF